MNFFIWYLIISLIISFGWFFVDYYTQNTSTSVSEIFLTIVFSPFVIPIIFLQLIIALLKRNR